MKTYLFKNARFYALSPDETFNWMTVIDGRIYRLGRKKDDIPNLDYDQIIDLKNKTVLPAFGDAHLHSLWMARTFFEADLSKARSLQQALEILTDFARSAFLPADWLIGRGYNKNLWKDGQPHRKFLDARFPTRPVFLQSQDYHSAWLNTVALKRCGISARTPDPAGGRIDKDANGNLTGLFYDRAVDLALQHLPPADAEQLEKGVQQLVRRLHAKGITTIHTMEDAEAFSFWQSFQQKHPRQMRVVVYFLQTELEQLIAGGLRSGFGNEWLRIGGIKFFSDGSLGSQTALLSKPYEHTKNLYGLELMPEKELRERIRLAECHGLAVAVHAIGDRAVERVLKALERNEACRKKFRLISRIEHVQLIRPDLLPLFNQYGLVASMQPIHIADDVPTAERHWGKRSRWAYAFRSIKNTGVPLAFGSDAPVAEPDPIKGIFSAVNRRFQFSLNEPAWYPEERLTVAESIRAFTQGVAQAAGQEQAAGSFAPGKQTDFIVLNADPFTMSEEEILTLKIEQTFLSGERVFPEME